MNYVLKRTNRIFKEIFGLQVKDVVYAERSVEILLKDNIEDKGVIKKLAKGLEQDPRSVRRRYNKMIEHSEENIKDRYKIDNKPKPVEFLKHVMDDIKDKNF